MFAKIRVFLLLAFALALLTTTGCESEVKKKQRLEKEMVIEAVQKVDAALIITQKVQDSFVKEAQTLSPGGGETKLKDLKKFFTESEKTFRDLDQDLKRLKLPDSTASDNFRGAYEDLFKNLIEMFADFNKNYDIVNSNPWNTEVKLNHVARNIGRTDFSLLDLQTQDLNHCFNALCKYYSVEYKKLAK